MIASALSGFSLGFALILAIGAQNAFVLRQGLRGEHVLAVVLVCAISDALLITLGVAGFGALNERFPWLEPAMRYGGAAFLIAYGLRSLWSAFTATDAMDAGKAAPSLRAAVATCLALTWLNPHVYLDTVALIGAISTQSPSPRAFGAGAVAASFTFFFALGYGASLLRPLFARPRAWRILDALIGVVMLALAAKLLELL
jgi:L-lysine exporter family protein LysE/ArgO